MKRSYSLPWHYVAGALAMVLPFVPNRLNNEYDGENTPAPQYKQPFISSEASDWSALITFSEGKAEFFVRGDETSATIQVETVPSLEDFAERILSAVDDFVGRVKQAKRLEYRTSPEGAIESYYRAKVRNTKITLADIAERTGYTESYLRKVKVKYDREGLWGSKSKSGSKK